MFSVVYVVCAERAHPPITALHFLECWQQFSSRTENCRQQNVGDKRCQHSNHTANICRQHVADRCCQHLLPTNVGRLYWASEIIKILKISLK